MGVRIKSTGTSRDTDTFSIVELSARAAKQSLERAGVRADQVGVLINAGIFRDSNTVEPAVSALIQKAAGIGLDYEKNDPRSFSFDLMNAGVGVLNAVQVGQSILALGGVEHVLVVSGDTHPSLKRGAADDEFPYASAGAALLLEYTEEPEGFGRVHTVSGAGSPVIESYVDVATMGTRGREIMTHVREADAEERLLAVAVDAARTALAEAALTGAAGSADTSGGASATGVVDSTFPLATTALIASTPTAGFPARLAAELGIAADAVRTPDLSQGDPHTAALPLAYDLAVRDESLRGFTHVLFVAAGAGPSAAAVVYRLPALVGADA